MIRVPVEGDIMNGDEAIHDAEVIERILAQIGENVAFTFPAGEGEMQGVLEDRFAMRGGNGPNPAIRFYDVIDRIVFDGQMERWMRFGFYRELPDGHLVFAAQNTLAAPESEWDDLFKKAWQEKPWFREFIERLLREFHRQYGPRAD